MATPTTLPATFVAGNVLTAAQMNNLRGAFRVLQVVSTNKTDIFSASLASGATTDITGLSASITPSSTDSKVLVLVSFNGIQSTGGNFYASAGFQLKRASTIIGGGTTAGSRTSASATDYQAAINSYANSNLSTNFLDSPATTSATTYQVVMFNNREVTMTCYLNQVGNDGNTSNIGRLSSTITLMEISA
jgi:hypothetical protein